MQISSVIPIKSRKVKGLKTSKSKDKKLIRRNRRIERAIKHGEYKESNSVRQEDSTPMSDIQAFLKALTKV